MKASEYELLLNKVYNEGILQQQNARTQLYLRMHEDYSNLKNKKSADNLQKSEFEFRKSFFMVRNYVQQAINDGLKYFRIKMGKEDVTQLTFMAATLNRNFFDKPSLDQIIMKANSVFKQYN